MEYPDASGSDLAQTASELLDRRRTQHARAMLRAGLSSAPDHPDLLFQVARADAIDGDNESARAALAQVLAREPKHFGARALLTCVLTDLDELPAAESVVLDLLREYPQSADLYAAYARVMLRALYVSKARQLAGEALRLDPGSASALSARALCDIVELPNAVDSTAVRMLIADHPDEERTLGVLLAALTNAGRHREALRVSQALLLAQPNDPEYLRVTAELKAACHWSMLPLWPLQRWGWSASIALWMGGIALSQAATAFWPAASPWVIALVLGYVIYSWVWPSIIKRWVGRT